MATETLPTLLEANPRGHSSVTQLAIHVVGTAGGAVTTAAATPATANVLRYLTATPYATDDAGTWRLTDAGWVAYAVLTGKPLPPHSGAPEPVREHVAEQWAAEQAHHEAHGWWRL